MQIMSYISLSVSLREYITDRYMTSVLYLLIVAVPGSHVTLSAPQIWGVTLNITIGYIYRFNSC